MDTSRISCEVTVSDETTTIVAAGELDAETRRTLADLLDAAAASASRVVVDLRAVTFIDSSGLHALLTARQRHPHTRLVVRDPSPAVERVLDLTGTASLFLDGITHGEPRDGQPPRA